MVDFNPEVVKKILKLGLPVIYGDGSDPDIQEKMRLDKARVLISTIPDFQDNLSLIEFVKQNGYAPKMIFSVNNIWEEKELYKAGVDYVIIPKELGGREVARLLEENPDFQ